MNDETLGQFIYRHRKLRGLTQEELARAVGITKAYVCIIERGDQAGREISVSPPKLSAIAAALRVPPEDVFNRAGILPAGTVLVRHDNSVRNCDHDAANGKNGNIDRSGEQLSDKPARDWNELFALGYCDLPPHVREEVKRYIEFRSSQIKE